MREYDFILLTPTLSNRRGNKKLRRLPSFWQPNIVAYVLLSIKLITQSTGSPSPDGKRSKIITGEFTMFKRFNISGLGRRSILPVTAEIVLVSPRMDKTGSKSSGNKPAAGLVSRYFGRILAVLAAIALLIGGGWYYYDQHSPMSVPPMAVQTPSGYISNDQMEAQYGVRITLIAVTAAGGIVDFRYKVIDPQKAAVLLHDPANTPILTAMDSGHTLSPTGMSRHHRQMSMKRGAVPFTFYPNVRGAVKPGTLVSVAFGNIKVEPIAAQ
jgi:hypothetical protein